jgi:hypothetical protein
MRQEQTFRHEVQAVRHRYGGRKSTVQDEVTAVYWAVIDARLAEGVSAYNLKLSHKIIVLIFSTGLIPQIDRQALARFPRSVANFSDLSGSLSATARKCPLYPRKRT